VTVNNQDVGGSAFTSSQIAIHGGRAGEQQLLYDGMMYNNGQGRGGQYTAIATNDGTVQEVSLETGGLGAESEMSGIRTNVIPKEGGNTFRGTFSGGLHQPRTAEQQPHRRLQGAGLLTVSTVHKIYDVNPGFGGPLMKDKVWFYTRCGAGPRSSTSRACSTTRARCRGCMSPIPRGRRSTSRPTATRASPDLAGHSREQVQRQYQYGQQDRPFYGYSLGQTLASPEGGLCVEVDSRPISDRSDGMRR
jgi:hypothetical protein